jgi:hypothetical protein
MGDGPFQAGGIRPEVRLGVIDRLTRAVGFVDRGNLARNIQDIAANATPENKTALLDRLTRQGVLKNVNALDGDLAKVGLDNINRFIWKNYGNNNIIETRFQELVTPDLFRDRILNSPLYIAKGLYTAGAWLTNKGTRIFSYEIGPENHKLNVWKWVGYGLLGIGLYQLGGIYLGLGVANMLVREAKLRVDKVDPTTFKHAVLDLVANKFSWIVTAGNVLALSGGIYNANLFIPSAIEELGKLGATGSGLLIVNYVGKTLFDSTKEHNIARLGQIAPGERSVGMTRSAVRALMFERGWLQTRLLLFLPAMANLGLSLISYHPLFASIFFPVVGLSTFAALKARSAGVSNEVQTPWSNLKLNFKAYQHWGNIVAGFLATGGISALMGDPTLLQAYALIVGAPLAMGQDLHTTGASMNTNRGALYANNLSSILPIGIYQILQLAWKKINVFTRTDTGPGESTLGVEYTARVGEANPTVYMSDANLKRKNYRINADDPTIEQTIIEKYRYLISAISEKMTDKEREKEQKKRRDDLIAYIQQQIKGGHISLLKIANITYHGDMAGWLSGKFPKPGKDAAKKIVATDVNVTVVSTGEKGADKQKHHILLSELNVLLKEMEMNANDTERYNEAKKDFISRVEIAFRDNQIKEITVGKSSFAPNIGEWVNKILPWQKDQQNRMAFLNHISEEKEQILNGFKYGEDGIHISDVKRLTKKYGNSLDAHEAFLNGFKDPDERSEKSDLIIQYRATIDNLRYVAKVLTKMQNELGNLFKARSAWFKTEESEYIESNNRMVESKIALLRQFADDLQTDLDEERISGELLDRKMTQDVKIDGYDEHRLSQIIALARKLLNMDDKRVRKVENVATWTLLRAFTMFEFAFDEITGQPMETIDMIAGTYTKVLNPEYSWRAKPGTFGSAPEIWVPLKKVLDKLDQHDGGPTKDLNDRDKVGSTSKLAKEIDNTPMESEGFNNPDHELAVEINDQKLDVKKEEIFWLADPSKNKHDGIPWIKTVKLRSGSPLTGKQFTEAMEKTGVWNCGFKRAFTIPYYDVSTVADKMDTVFADKELAALYKYKYNIPDAYVKVSYKFPLGKGKGRNLKDDKVYDVPMAFWVTNSKGEKFYAPYILDPTAVRDMLSTQDPKNDITLNMRMYGAKIKLSKDGTVEDFRLMYSDKDDPKRKGAPIKNAEVTVAPSDRLPDRFAKYLYLDNSGLKKDKDGYYTIEGSDYVEYKSDGPHLAETGDKWIIYDSKKKKYILGQGHRDDWREQLGEAGENEEPAYENYGLLTPVRKAFFRATGVDFTKLGIKLEEIVTVGKEIIVSGHKYKAGKFIQEKYDPKNGDSFSPVQWKGMKKVNGCVGVVEAGDKHLFVDLDISTEQAPGMGQRIYARAHDIIDIISSGKKLIVRERIPHTTGNPIDYSRAFYSIDYSKIDQKTAEKLRKIDLRDVSVKIKDIDTVVIEWSPIGTGIKETINVPTEAFIDQSNSRSALFKNKALGITGLDNIYQSDKTTPENMEFQPRLDIYPDGGIMLQVDLIRTYEIDKPQKLIDAEAAIGKNYVIHASAAYSAVKINGQYIPLNERIAEGKYNFDMDMSGVERAQVVSIVNEQNRVGFPSKLPIKHRDNQFYGLKENTTPRTRRVLGSNGGIEISKREEIVCSGRTTAANAEEYVSSSFEIMETNNQFYGKPVAKGKAKGVGEDEDFKQDLRAIGKIMQAMRESFDTLFLLSGNIMPAEWKIGNWISQSVRRYIFSERLFLRRFNQFIKQEIERVYQKDRPILITKDQGSELMWGRLWYKYPFAAIIEIIAPIVYICTGGLVAWIPFDNVMVAGAWALKNIFSPVNYVRMLMTLGFRTATAISIGFFKSKAIDYSVLLEGFQVAAKQFLERNQWANFILTSAGGKITIKWGQMMLSGVLGSATAITLGVGLAFFLGAPVFGIGVATFFTGMQLLQFVANITYMMAANKGVKTNADIQAEFDAMEREIMRSIVPHAWKLKMVKMLKENIHDFEEKHRGKLNIAGVEVVDYNIKATADQVAPSQIFRTVPEMDKALDAAEKILLENIEKVGKEKNDKYKDIVFQKLIDTNNALRDLMSQIRALDLDKKPFISDPKERKRLMDRTKTLIDQYRDLLRKKLEHDIAIKKDEEAAINVDKYLEKTDNKALRTHSKAAAYGEYTRIKAYVDGVIILVGSDPDDYYKNVSYNDMKISWGRLRDVLIELGAMDTYGIVQIDEFHDLRDISVPILELWSKLEVTMSHKARYELSANPMNEEARDALDFVEGKSTDFTAGYVAEQASAFAGKYANKGK